MFRAFSPILLFPRVEGLIAYRLCVQDYAEFHTELTVCFVVRLTDASAKWGDKEIEDGFKLAKYVSLGNMHLYNENGSIKHYSGPLVILEEFFKFRIGCYEKRKVHEPLGGRPHLPS